MHPVAPVKVNADGILVDDDTVVTVVEVAKLPSGTCGQHIVETFEALRPGEAVEIVVGHDPAPLWSRFAAERAGQSVWTYLEMGPVTWRVRVERVR